ncbi:D-ribose pyranase [Corynebacterium striatum]|uniref:D-ribose pyranase n=1 Tax=Corynebacterium striatum TaxID=43770 RepID=UPI003AD44AB7
MKRKGILNSELSHAIAAMGHTDIMMVVDAGFPIPRDAWRIDLALSKDDPSIEKILQLISKEIIVETVSVAEEVPENNPALDREVRKLFPASEIGYVAHKEILEKISKEAKVIIRTGAFNPWGNVALTSGVFAPDWFNKPEVVTPPEYQKIIDRLKEAQ